MLYLNLASAYDRQHRLQGLTGLTVATLRIILGDWVFYYTKQKVTTFLNMIDAEFFLSFIKSYGLWINIRNVTSILILCWFWWHIEQLHLSDNSNDHKCWRLLFNTTSKQHLCTYLKTLKMSWFFKNCYERRDWCKWFLLEEYWISLWIQSNSYSWSLNCWCISTI